MKKRYKILIIFLVILLIIPLIPFLRTDYDDGGTTVYTALAYDVVIWNIAKDYGVYHQFRIYWFSNAWISLDEQWEIEKQTKEYKEFVKQQKNGTISSRF